MTARGRHGGCGRGGMACAVGKQREICVRDGDCIHTIENLKKPADLFRSPHRLTRRVTSADVEFDVVRLLSSVAQTLARQISSVQFSSVNSGHTRGLYRRSLTPFRLTLPASRKPHYDPGSSVCQGGVKRIYHGLHALRYLLAPRAYFYTASRNGPLLRTENHGASLLLVSCTGASGGSPRPARGCCQPRVDRSTLHRARCTNHDGSFQTLGLLLGERAQERWGE